jgi:hypothetical protein
MNPIDPNKAVRFWTGSHGLGVVLNQEPISMEDFNKLIPDEELRVLEHEARMAAASVGVDISYVGALLLAKSNGSRFEIDNEGDFDFVTPRKVDAHIRKFATEIFTSNVSSGWAYKGEDDLVQRFGAWLRQQGYLPS